MKQLALLVGNGAYAESPLNNPQNDAADLAAKLGELGFETMMLADAGAKLMERKLSEFAAQLAGYEVGLFFFAGHGMQIEGVNYLTAVDTDFQNEIDAKFSSLALDKVIEHMEAAGTKFNILILDACRTNPYERRWRAAGPRGLAPVYAPKGMIVAYATSPGQVASDGFGRNGAYTESLLKHIGQQNLSIEACFKRVRNTLSAATNARQISWEHTSLMGEYYFNNSLTDVAGVAGYSDQALADADFGPLASATGRIIADLRTHNWYRQNPAVAGVTPELLATASKDECFVLGRNIYQAACGEANAATAFVDDLKASLAPLPAKTGFHLLNGLLFEIYFDSRGRLRTAPKTERMESVFALEESAQHAESFRYLQQKLHPYRDRLFYFPGSLTVTCFDAVLVNYRGQPALQQIAFEGGNVLYHDGVGYFQLQEGLLTQSVKRTDLPKLIAAAAAVPRGRLKVSFSGESALAEKFQSPWVIHLRRHAPNA